MKNITILLSLLILLVALTAAQASEKNSLATISSNAVAKVLPAKAITTMSEPVQELVRPMAQAVEQRLVEVYNQRQFTPKTLAANQVADFLKANLAQEQALLGFLSNFAQQTQEKFNSMGPIITEEQTSPQLLAKADQLAVLLTEIEEYSAELGQVTLSDQLLNPELQKRRNLLISKLNQAEALVQEIHFSTHKVFKVREKANASIRLKQTAAIVGNILVTAVGVIETAVRAALFAAPPTYLYTNEYSTALVVGAVIAQIVVYKLLTGATFLLSWGQTRDTSYFYPNLTIGFGYFTLPSIYDSQHRYQAVKAQQVLAPIQERLLTFNPALAKNITNDFLNAIQSKLSPVMLDLASPCESLLNPAVDDATAVAQTKIQGYLNVGKKF